MISLTRVLTLPTAILALAAAVLLPAVPARAQHQVNTGQALDANPQVGSGGYNRVVGGRGGVNTQLGVSQRIVTGQVSGLGYFRGQIRYSSAESIQADVPTSELGTFRRQSVGIPDVVSGSPTYRSNVYFERSTTALRLNEIRSGLTSPGSNVPQRSSLSSRAAQRLLGRVYDQYAQDDDEPRGLMAREMPEQGSMVSITYDTPTGSTLARREALALSQPGAGATMGILRPDRRRELTRQLILARPLGMEAEAEDLSPALRRRLENRQAEVDANVGLIPKPLSERLRTDDQTRYRLRRNQDVFLEILARLEERQTGSTARRSIELTDLSESEEARVEAQADRVIMIRRLAGTGGDMFNDAMRKGEKLLKQGKFYDASTQFEIAAITDRRNPLARIGLGLSLFAADEHSSAASQIKRALETFPGLIATRVDVVNLLGGDVYQRELKVLLDRIAESKAADGKPIVQPEMYFLAAFMLHNTERHDAAEAFASSLLTVNDLDPTFKRYATYLMKRSRGTSDNTTNRDSQGPRSDDN